MIRAVLVAALLGLAPCGTALARDCPKLPACEGCGCRGGPGYRGPDGHCVGFRELSRVCGGNPAERCKFEDLPNTGLSRDCALRP